MDTAESNPRRRHKKSGFRRGVRQMSGRRSSTRVECTARPFPAIREIGEPRVLPCAEGENFGEILTVETAVPTGESTEKEEKGVDCPKDAYHPAPEAGRGTRPFSGNSPTGETVPCGPCRRGGNRRPAAAALPWDLPDGPCAGPAGQEPAASSAADRKSVV